MGSKNCRTVSDLSRHGYQLRVECRVCHHRELLDPVPVAIACHNKGWPRDLDALALRMRCSRCGKREATCGPG